MKSRKSSGIEVLALVAVVTIVVSVAGASSFTFDTLNSVSEKAKESLLAVRVAGDLIEMYGDEHLVFPGPTDGLVPLASLRQTLDIPAPRYFPQHDAWGHGLLYWSNGTTYLIISTGADAAADVPYQTWTTAQFLVLLNMPPSTQTDLRKDILFGQGQFIQWPAGIVP